MKTYTVEYSLTGYVNMAADETTPHDLKTETFSTRDEAIARGRELVKQLGLGGRVYIGEEMNWDNGIPTIDEIEFVAHVSRDAEGDGWFVNENGIDLRS